LKNKGSIESQLKAAEKELAKLNERKIQLEYEIKHLRNLQHSIAEKTYSFNLKTKPGITSESPEDQKISLFRSLFRGREDVFPKRFESKRTGKSGYQPVCRNEWVRPLCQKPKIKCGECDNRDFEPIILTQAMEKRPEMGFESYDRFFPSQDTLPKGGFGNLIALPLQKMPRDKGNTLFVDDVFKPCDDPWAFLSNIQRMSLVEVESIVDKSFKRGGVLGVKFVSTEEDEIAPWLFSPSGKRPETKIVGPLPNKVELVLGNQIYIAKEGLPPALKNKLIRLAAFQNPDFYKAQAMRFPTYDKPRIVYCCEDFPEHIGLPRGCLEDAVELLSSLNIETHISDKRFMGNRLDVNFLGDLYPKQKDAAAAMLAHDTGVLSAATAFGKTVVAAYLVAERSVNTLVLVHRKQLLDQWMSRLKTFLDIADESIGQIGGGKRNPSGLIDVATIQSLSRKGVVDDIVADYGYIIVDECHHISDRSFEIVARQSKAKYVSGLSATVKVERGHNTCYIFMAILTGKKIMEKIINIHIEKLPEGIYLATSDDIQGLVAQGRTATEALEIARDVARKLIEAKIERSGDLDLALIDDSFEYPLIVNT
jgi:predicted RNase H-like HicB family nuclease